MQINLRTVLDEAQSNELRPTAELHGRQLLISGEVESTGVKHQGRTDIHMDGATLFWNGGMAFSTAHTNQASEVIPYAVLSPGDGEKGRCVCFFYEHELQAVAALEQGAHVVVHATLERFAKQGEQELLIADCTLQE